MAGKTDPRTLAQVRQALNKKFGLGTIRDLTTIEQVAVIPTGALLVDHALGVGGLPRGRMVELYGEESSGKSTLALLAAAQCQRQGDAVLYMDYEHSFVSDYALLLGVSLDPDLFLLSQPEHLEQGFEILEAILDAGGVGLAVVDSLAAMVPQKELEGEIGDTFVAVQARAMSQALRRFTPAVDRSNTCVVFINHTRMVIGGFNPTGQERKTTPGGKALKFYASHRVELSRLKTLRGPVMDPITGVLVDGAATIQFQAKVVKNKLAPPAKIGYFYLDAVRGHLDARAVLDVAAARGLVATSGSRYTLDGTALNGVMTASAYLDDHPDLLRSLRRQVSDALAGERDGGLCVAAHEQGKPALSGAEAALSSAEAALGRVGHEQGKPAQGYAGAEGSRVGRERSRAGDSTGDAKRVRGSRQPAQGKVSIAAAEATRGRAAQQRGEGSHRRGGAWASTGAGAVSNGRSSTAADGVSHAADGVSQAADSSGNDRDRDGLAARGTASQGDGDGLESYGDTEERDGAARQSAGGRGIVEIGESVVSESS